MSDIEDRGAAYAFQLLAKKVDKVALAHLGMSDELCAMPELRRLVQKVWADGYRTAYEDEMEKRPHG